MIPGRLADDWSRYWFEVDAPLSVGVARIAIGLSALWLYVGHLAHDVPQRLAESDPAAYQPDGILALFGSALPPPGFFRAWQIVALVSSTMALIGLFSRFSMALSLLATLILAGLTESFYEGWGHQCNIVLLAQMAFLFARSGDRLSVDRFLLRLRNRGDLGAAPERHAPIWPVLLAQWAVALMFLNGAYWKLSSDHFHFGWALSDNFRNVLLVQYPWMGRTMPDWLQWVADHPFAYKGLALGNIVAQTMPMVACFLTRRPAWRAVFGFFFVIESIALGLVMSIWDLHWLPLYALFVDWDALLGRSASRGIGPRSPRWRRIAAGTYIAAFLAADVTIAFLLPPDSHFKLNTYPFSQFRMYSDIKAKTPYATHQAYELMGVTFELECDSPGIDAAAGERLLQRHHYSLTSLLEYESIQSALANVRAFVRQNITTGPYRLKVYRTVFQATAYPAPAALKIASRGLMAITDSGGDEKIVFARARLDPETNRNCLELQYTGYDDPQLGIGYRLDFLGDEKPLPGELIGSRYSYQPAEHGRYLIVIHVRDRSLGAEHEDVYYADYPYH